MKTNNLLKIATSFLFVIILIASVSALVVDADYITIFSGEDGKISVDIENNHNFDIEDISMSLELDEIPFTSVGSSEKDIDDIDEDDDDSVSFTLRASTDITPGDYNIPYKVKYTNVDTDERETKEGSFGIRVSAKTEIDFSVETKDAILEKQGRVSLKIVNKGLGEVRFVDVQIFPQAYELLSTEKIYIGNIDSDDSDFASFDVIFKSTDTVLSAKVDYKDFDNNEKSETVNLPFKVYTQEEALELGLIQKSNTLLYLGVVVVLVIVWFGWRTYRKSKKRKQREELKQGR